MKFQKRNPTSPTRPSRPNPTRQRLIVTRLREAGTPSVQRASAMAGLQQMTAWSKQSTKRVRMSLLLDTPDCSAARAFADTVVTEVIESLLSSVRNLSMAPEFTSVHGAAKPNPFENLIFAGLIYHYG